MAAKFTIDWETWFNAVTPAHYWRYYGTWTVVEPTRFLLDILDKYEVKAIWYVLGWLRDMRPSLYEEIKDRGHVIGSHGYWHGHNETGDGLFRSPYWDKTPMPFPPSGGFFFRALPYSIVRSNVLRSGVFWLHPHDVMDEHPKLKNHLLNLKRQIGLKNSREKLERLLSEVEWDEPSKN